MRKIAFTLVEILLAVVIMGILATIAIPIYRNVLEDAKAKACEANLKVLSTALSIYAMEHDVMPADLSQIPPDYLQRAYARILQEKGAWKLKLAYFIIGRQQRGLAYAGLLQNIAQGNLNFLTCPADPTPPAKGGRSYGLNANLAGMSAQEFRQLSGNMVLVGDSESATFQDVSDLSPRHKHFTIIGSRSYALGADKAGEIWDSIRGWRSRLRDAAAKFKRRGRPGQRRIPRIPSPQQRRTPRTPRHRTNHSDDSQRP